MQHDLILKGARVIDPSQNHDGICDVAFADGRVSGFGRDLPAGPGTQVRDMEGAIVTPGLIDLHTHVYWGGTSLGIDADEFCRTSGVTTSVDTGSAGPGNFAGFRGHVIERSQARILAYLHVSFAGIFGFSKTIMVGESEDPRLMAPREAVEVAEANRDVIVGIKVRVGRHASGDQGTAPLDIALQVAEETGLPLMAHIDEPPPSYEAVLAMLRPGDVLTHAFRPFPNSPVTAQGAVKPALREARARGGAVRHRPRQGLLRLPDGAGHAGGGLPAGHDLVGRAPALHRGAGLRPSHHHVEDALPRHEPHRRHRRLHGERRRGAEAHGIRDLEGRGAGRRHRAGGAGRGLRLRRHAETMTGAQRITAEGVVLKGRWWHPA